MGNLNSNSNVTVKQLENLLIIDPNGKGSESVNVEDLSISVELEVLQRDDAQVIYVDNNNTPTTNPSSEATRISFIDGTGSEKSYLTTHYTELNTKFNDENKDLGTLGIETIDISFNTSYVPIVKIRFKDIRAKLFELGDESPYSFMFRMPYPIFYLTVKGYYGKPVQYALHMTKFNGELDNDTGSFIITCDFIGYTYAFLADLLMGLLKGIPYTKKGLSIIEGFDNFITFEQLGTNVKELEDSVIQFKNTNKKLKALTIYDDLNTKLEGIKGSLQQQLRSLNNNFYVLSDINITESKNMAFAAVNNNLTTDNIEKYEKSTLKLIEIYNNINLRKGGTETYELNPDFFQLDSNGIYYSKLFYRDFTIEKEDSLITNDDGISSVARRPMTFKELQKTNAINIYKNFKATGDIEIDNLKEIYYSKFINILKTKYSVNERGVSTISKLNNVIDINLALKRIELIQSKLTTEYNEKKKLVTKEFTNSINTFLEQQEIKFDSSIGSLFKILCDHVDVFIKVLKSVETDINKDIKEGLRQLPATSKESFSDYIDTDNSTDISVRAWPEYITKEESTDDAESDSAYVEKWLGSDIRFSNYKEVEFIDDLYASMIKAAKKEKELIQTIGENKKGWFPVNPLETLAFNKSNTNPWEAASDENVEPIIKLMLQRMTIFLAFSHKNLTLPQVQEVAKIEANQCYNSIINLGAKNAIIPVSADDTQPEKKRIEFVGTSESNFGRIGKFQGLRFYFDDPLGSNNSFVVYHHDKPDPEGGFKNFKNAFNLRPEYIPINQTSKTLKSDSNKLNIPYNRSQFDGTFISNVISNTELNDDILNSEESETFIKIIDDGEYKASLNYESYIPTNTNRITEAGALVSENSDYIGGIYKTHEFTTYKHKGLGNIPLYYEFYTHSLKQNLKLIVDGNETHLKFNPTFMSNSKPYSLFGTKWYYNQTEEAKALLFLHTIPFDGFVDVEGQKKIEKTLLSVKNIKFFNERAGFVSIPNSWALLMGGLLYRASQDKDIIKFTLNNGTILIPDSIDASTIYKNKYLISAPVGKYLGVTHNDGPMHFTSNQIYQDISDEIIYLPNSVKKVFINHFISWVNGEWKENIKPSFEIFESGISNTRIDNVWNVLNNNPNDLSGFNSNVSNNYEVSVNKIEGNFDLTVKQQSDLDDIINSFIFDDKILINSTYKIWEGSKDNLSNFELPFSFYSEYLKTFFETYRGLNVKNTVDPEVEIIKTVFDNDKVDDIKLSLYKNVKSIYNKWVIGVHPNMDSIITGDLYNSFKFLDRAYIDISKKFKISPMGFIDYLSTNANISFYNFIAEILRSNNFDFIPLPTFVDYETADDAKSIFEPIRFKESLKSASQPRFICMYFGERSNQLNIDKKIKTRQNDSVDIKKLPKDFKKGNQNIPYFLVNYADQNQSIFKKINLNQAEFTETNESLEIIESISHLNRNNSIGQNLFDIYNNRAYSAEVEMLGCAQIQPFMFFQVNNVPIFDGAYTIINTRHQIKANHMTTSFKGVRIRNVKTKMIDDETLYAHLLTNLNEVDNEDANLNDFNDKIPIKSNEQAVNPELNPELNPALISEAARGLNNVNSGLVELYTRVLTKSSNKFGLPQYAGFRTNEEQNSLFRKVPSVTKLDGYIKKSYHQTGNAFDIFVYDDNNNACYDCPQRYSEIADLMKSEFELMKSEGVFRENEVLKWGGDWTKFVDLPHFELRVV